MDVEHPCQFDDGHQDAQQTDFQHAPWPQVLKGAHAHLETGRDFVAMGVEQHPEQQGDLQRGGKNNGQSGDQCDEGDLSLGQRLYRSPQRYLVVQALHADADDREHVGKDEHHERGNAQRQQLFDGQAMTAAQHGGAAQAMRRFALAQG